MNYRSFRGQLLLRTLRSGSLVYFRLFVLIALTAAARTPAEPNPTPSPSASPSPLEIGPQISELTGAPIPPADTSPSAAVGNCPAGLITGNGEVDDLQAAQEITPTQKSTVETGPTANPNAAANNYFELNGLSNPSSYLTQLDNFWASYGCPDSGAWQCRVDGACPIDNATTADALQWAANKWGLQPDLLYAAATQIGNWQQYSANTSASCSSGVLQVADCNSSSQTSASAQLAAENTCFDADLWAGDVWASYNGLNPDAPGNNVAVAIQSSYSGQASATAGDATSTLSTNSQSIQTDNNTGTQTCQLSANATSINCGAGQSIPQAAGTYIVSGTCDLRSNLNLAAGETIEASSSGATINGNGQYTVIANGANNISIYGFTFENLPQVNVGSGFPGGGIELEYTSKVNIGWNTFENCSYGCITGINVSNSAISSNTINGVSGNEGSFEAAISLAGVSNSNQITQNLIENDGTQGVAWYGSNNQITRNVFSNVATDCHDCGAIYTWDPGEVTSGTQITDNYISDAGGNNGCGDGVNAIYLDNGVSDITVQGNTIVNSKGMGNGIFVHGGANDQVTDNTVGMGPCGTGIGAATGSGGSFTAYVDQGNTVESASQVSSTSPAGVGPVVSNCYSTPALPSGTADSDSQEICSALTSQAWLQYFPAGMALTTTTTTATAGN
jgi:Right handed beta helix region